MSDISEWSNSASSNTAASPNGFPEGMAPSGVNDSAREIMAAVRRFVEDGGWFDWGHTCTRTSNTTFTVPTDVSETYHIGRRVRAVGATTGTIYGTITDSVYTSVTSVTVDWDSGQMNGETIAISLGYLSAADTSFSGVALTGDQTIAGVKTFSSFPVGPSSLPASDYQLANKKYVDSIPAFSSSIVSSAKTANYTLLTTDKGSLITFDGTYTLSLLAAAVVGSGFYCWVKNISTKVVTVAASGAETIMWHGAATSSIKLYSYQAVLLQCNGTTWQVIGAVGMASPGEIRMTGLSTAPAGWFMCDGTAYDKNIYTGLFEAIGYSYDQGKTHTGNNFFVPDMRLKFPLGTLTGTANLGSYGGDFNHTHSVAAHTHIVTRDEFRLTATGDDTKYSSPAATDSGGAGTSGTNNPPYVVVNFIIKY